VITNRLLIIIYLAALLTIGGCTTFTATPEKSLNEYIIQERNFAGALHLLRAGKEQEASELFELVVSGPQTNGITDEALFRLALIQLRDSRIKSVARAEKLLERLKKEYPKSIWRYQAEPLIAFLDNSIELRKNQRELKNLRELNVSLTKNNRELRQTIERLKELDIELEQKIRR
jgi:hypothetical protein